MEHRRVFTGKIRGEGGGGECSLVSRCWEIACRFREKKRYKGRGGRKRADGGEVNTDGHTPS